MIAMRQTKMSSATVSILILGIAASAVACGSTPGAKPHDMSAASHVTAANAEETHAAEHTAQYDPNAKPDAKKDCTGSPKLPCWNSDRNPTAKHLEMAEAHRKAAADHRAAAKALAEAESRACSGLAPSDRDMSPFAHREDLAGVTPLTENVVSGKTKSVKTVGAVIKVRAVPGLTAEWLQRIVTCHLARASALGHEMPEMPYCPLVPKGATAQVESAGDGFNVSVRSDDPEAAKEILRRASALTGQ